MSLNRYDDLVTFWERDGVRGLQKIIKEGLGTMMVGQMEKLARDAYLKIPFGLYGDGSGGFSGSGFNTIDSSDVINTRLLSDIRLGLFERDNPAFDNEMGIGDELVCITSPGVIEDLRFEASASFNGSAFIDVMKYANPRNILTGEVGMYHGVRFLKSNNAVLYNSGAIVAQANITVPVMPGDGSPDPTTTAVDKVEYVGQAAAAHGITVSELTGFNVGDYVAVHVRRTNAHGVTNGLDHTDGKLHQRRIVAKSGASGAGTISFERPILEKFDVDLGAGVYGYVTKAQNVHTALFLAGKDAIVMGTAQAPIIHTPRPVDDFDMIQRFTFDMYMGWQPFNKQSAEIVYLAGSNRLVGPRYLTKV